MLRLNQILFHAINIIIVSGWIFMIFKWIKDGAKVPKWLNVLAILVLFVSIMLYIILYKEIKYILIVFIPPLFVYLIWLWLYGPDHKRNDV